MLTLKQIVHVCKGDSNPGSGCRYLERDDLEPSKYYCLKLVELKRYAIDKEVEDYISKSRGKVPSQDMMLGDNCSGYLKLKSVWQGFDVRD